MSWSLLAFFAAAVVAGCLVAIIVERWKKPAKKDDIVHGVLGL